MDYSLVTLFPEKINKEIEKLKRDISKLGPRSGLNTIPYLELRKGFDVPINKVNELIKGFNQFKKRIKPIQIKILDFLYIENISNDPWIKDTFSVSIKVIESKELIDLNNKLNEFKLFSDIKEEDYHPCILLAKEDLDKFSFERVKKFLKEKTFEKTFTLNNITFILNKNNNQIIYKKLRI